MYFDSVRDFLQMDGHGIFVWPAYGLTLLVLSYLLLAPWRRQRLYLQRLASERRRRTVSAAAKADTNGANMGGVKSASQGRG